MFNTTLSPTSYNFSGMPFRGEGSMSPFKRKSSEDDYGFSLGIQRSDSHDAKRRRTPSCREPPPSIQCPLSPHSPQSPAAEPHPPQILPHSLSFGRGNCNQNYHHQRLQLNTPPLDSLTLSIHHSLDADDDMKDEDMVMLDGEICHSYGDSPYGHHWMIGPLSPLTPSPGAILDHSHHHDGNHKEPTADGSSEKDEAFEDPNATVWNGRGRVLRKNLNGQVKGFKMGYLEGCERCRMKERGHFGHFIMANS